jgi:serine/threonine protein kinase
MNAEETRQRILELFEAALQEKPAKRPEYLLQACGANDQLWAEVSSLVAEYEFRGETVEPPPAVSGDSRAHLPAAGSLAGTTIGHYEVGRELGRGGMGVVFEARDLKIGRTIALKTIRLDQSGSPVLQRWQRERLFREARSAGALSHPNIVTIYESDAQEDLAYIAMEYVDGPTLQQRMSAVGRFPAGEALDLLRQAAEALDYAHEAGVVHRDIKPANLMLNHGKTVKVTDFGIAKLTIPDQMTRTAVLTGTPGYMSPEQIQGLAVDGMTDQFSLAVVAYEMLIGWKPFRAESIFTIVHQIVYGDRPAATSAAPDLPPAVDDVFYRALARSHEERYGSCAEFVAELEQALGSKREEKGDPVNARTGGAEKSGIPGLHLPAAETHIAKDEPHRGKRRFRVMDVVAGFAVNVQTHVRKLDVWRSGHQRAPDDETGQPIRPVIARSSNRRIRMWVLCGIAMACVITAAVWWQSGLMKRRSPVRTKLVGSILTALDEDDRPVWSYRLPNVPDDHTGALTQRVSFVDLDGDGRKELLYVYFSPDAKNASPTVYCINQDGKARWTWQPGRTVRTPLGRQYSGPFFVNLIGVLNQARKDGGRIVVGSHHMFDWPYQLALLSAEGKVVSEYWHAGWFFDMNIVDFDCDGIEEVLLGGVNDSYADEMEDGRNYRATFVVLGSRQMGGSGVVRPGDDNVVDGIPPAQERAVLVFRGLTATGDANRFYEASGLEVFADGHIDVILKPSSLPHEPFAYFDFDSQLHLTSVSPEANLREKLIAELPRTATAAEQMTHIMERLGKIRYLKNDFGAQGSHALHD